MACRGTPPPLTAQVDGEFTIAGLSAPVRIVRDRWGVPHIYAESQTDLFIAQGFVQAQDRLFQMDLWRRAAQGRLSEVFGSNFAGRDAMTRRIQYRGDPAADWASYGPETETIAKAFVTGINAWVAAARERPPEEFLLAGWKPDEWAAVDLLNRTDAFLAGGDALQEVERRQLSYVIGDVIRRIGTAPFFIGLDGEVRGATDGDGTEPVPPSKAIESARQRAASPTAASTSGGEPLAFSESTGTLASPSMRYAVHLHAPGWNVAGLTRPWLPGVAIGHNEHVAWSLVPYAADTQDIYEEPLDASAQTQVTEALPIFGRTEPLEFDMQFTARGVVVTTDKERGVAYSLRWSGSEPGTAAELGGLGLNRAGSAGEFRSALAQWKLPVRTFVFSDVAGSVHAQVAGLVPVRRGIEWQGWMTLDDLPHEDGVDRVAVTEDRAGQAAVDPQAVFPHVLAINQAATRRFNVGPTVRPSDDAPVRGSWDPSGWDRSAVMNAPGQSESPGSPHSRDLVASWSAGGMVPLVFSDAEVEKNAVSTLTLVPSR